MFQKIKRFEMFYNDKNVQNIKKNKYKYIKKYIKIHS